jgi:hypothetical protein
MVVLAVSAILVWLLQATPLRRMVPAGSGEQERRRSPSRSHLTVSGSAPLE